MKKLKLDQQKFAGAEVLSRAQLRKVMGGSGSGPDCLQECKNDGDLCYGLKKCTFYAASSACPAGQHLCI